MCNFKKNQARGKDIVNDVKDVDCLDRKHVFWDQRAQSGGPWSSLRALACEWLQFELPHY